MEQVTVRDLLRELRQITSTLCESIEEDATAEIDTPHGASKFAYRATDEKGRPQLIFVCGLNAEGRIAWLAMSTQEKDIGFLSAAAHAERQTLS